MSVRAVQSSVAVKNIFHLYNKKLIMGTLKRTLPQSKAQKRTYAAIILASIAIISIQTIQQTMAFSPSSKNYLTTKSELTIGTSSNNKNTELTKRTKRVSNFATTLHAASSSSAILTEATTKNSIASNLAVSLDRPLLSPVEYTYRAPSASRSVWSSFLAVLVSDVFKTALVAFILALGVNYFRHFFNNGTVVAGGGGGGAATAAGGGSEGGVGDDHESLLSKLSTLTKERIINPIQALLDKSPASSKNTKKSQEAYTTPMPFDGDGGWGKCTLRSKKNVGVSFTVYEFALPKSYYTVPLALGQALEFCCLSSNDDICTGSFYPYDVGGDGTGVVRVVLPNEAADDEGNAKFVSYY